ncbi:MAG: FAD-binding protein [Chloroflexia bacterium]|nr:FAD-binding protein [Chloroflexia bacterium]
MIRETNWAGNHVYRASTIHRPESVEELREIVSRAPRIHALGSRHCFNDIADSAELVSIDAIEVPVEIDREAMTVTVGASIRYGTLAQTLEREGFALHNMASLPHITVAGAVSTATHGSGDALGNLATAVSGIELVTSSGEMVTAKRGEPDFDGMVVGLGALGVVTRLTLDIEPTYQVRQVIYEDLAWDHVDAHFDEVMSSATSVSLFTDWGESVNSTWVKRRAVSGDEGPHRTDFFGARTATRNQHPVKSLPAEACTEQMGVPGAWADRLPHFRMDAVPASGDEIQAEYMIARDQALPAIWAFREAIQPYRDLVWISEVRTVAADNLWLSTAYGRNTVCLHTSFRHDQAAVDRILPVLEAALAPFEPRPHWGKAFAHAPRYERLADFRELARRLDPRGAFRSDYLERHVWG